MKRLLIYIIGVGLLMMACDIERSDNGDLDGLWQMTTKENLTTRQVNDMRDDNVSWAFQGGLVQMNSLAMLEVTAQFNYANDTISIYNLNHFDHSEGDRRIEDVSEVKAFGIYRLSEKYRVVELNGKSLLLQNDSVRLNFRKY